MAHEEVPIKLGQSNVEIATPLGIGTWPWSGDGKIAGGPYSGSGAASTTVTQQEAFMTSLKMNVNFFDTAEVYGLGASEISVGQCLQSKDYMDRGDLKEAVHLYQIHNTMTLRSLDTWTNAIGDVVDAGLVDSVGVSNYNAAQMQQAQELLGKRDTPIPLATNQIEYSLLHTNPEKHLLLEKCKELGVTVLAYSPLAMGRLTGKYTKDKPIASSRRLGHAEYDHLEALIALMKTIGEKHGGKTPSQVALNWCICKGTVPLVGAKNAEQAADNVGALGWRLDEGDMVELDKLSLPGTQAIFQEKF